ncbi:MAG: CHASE2 domain-containing protein, partial [Armatimonadetes bacterium]|nr:CHASE2 domain-containing protein [Armatimonadota bacterium]
MRASLRGTLWLGAICGLVAFLVGELGWLAGLDARAYDLGVRMRGSQPSSDVVVVEIDDESISRFGRWPWPRSLHARFLAGLEQRYRPSAVVFDLLLSEKEDVAQDTTFAREIGEAGNVYLAAFFTELARDEDAATREQIPWVTGEYVGEAKWSGKSFAGLQPPIPELAAECAGVGHVNVFRELDGYVRRVPLVIDHHGLPYLSLVAAVLNSQVNVEGAVPQVELGRELRLGEYAVPIDEMGEVLVSYAPSAEGDPAFGHYTYHSILTGDVPVNRLRDKVVLVGFGATGMADIHPTPLSAGAFGVEINAHALNGLLQGSVLRVAGGTSRLLFAVVLGVLACLTAARWGPATALTAVVILPALSIGAAILELRWQGVWLGAAPAALAAVIGYTSMVAVRYRESERDALRVNAGVEAMALATRVVASARRRADLLTEIRSQVHDAISALQINLYLMDEEQTRLQLLLPAHTERAPVSYAVGEGTVGWVARYPAVHLVEAVTPGTEIETELSHSVSFPVRSVAYAPLAHRGKVMGVMEAVRGVEQRSFEPRDLRILEALATEAAVALENVALYEKLEGRVEIANRKLLSAFQELKQERDRISAIVSNMADGVILSDERQRIVFMNPAAEAMFGVKADGVEGHGLAEVLPYETLTQQLSGVAEPTAQIPRIQVVKPRRMTLSPRTVLLTREGGGRAGAITVVSDITLLEELSEMKTEFVSIVSHELRTPLTSIMGFAQTLRGDIANLDEEERDDFLGIIEQESNRLLVMINDLLDMSRMEAGRPLPVNYAKIDLRKL